MEAVAKLKNYPTSPRKMRLLADLIRGLKVENAVAILEHHPQHSAIPLRKLVMSAVSNWKQKNEEAAAAKRTGTSAGTTKGDSQSTSDVLRDKAIKEAEERKNGSATNTGGSSSGSGSSGSGGSNKPKSTTPSYPATPMACKEYELLQTYIRSNVSYVRTVPIVNGKEVWGSAGGYWSNADFNKNPGYLPGSGDIQAFHGQINPITSVFTMYVVRGNTIYTKSVATNKGLIDWKKEAETQWYPTKLAPAFGFPEDGWITAYGEYFTVTGDATKTLRYFQYLKRDGKSYANDSMSFTYVNNQLQLDKTIGGKFNMVSDLRANPTALPGENQGEIIAQGD